MSTDVTTPASAPVHDLVVERDVRIPTGEPGITLSADVYRPATPGRVPALVTVLPYRKDFIAGATYEVPARWFAERGYASVIVDLRGTGASDGIRRPEFDPGEGDDAVAAIEWAAAAPWCDGSVGAWGLSYAANITLRAASRAPAALRAIVAVAHTLDAGRDSVHPDGARGDLHALLNRGTSMLLQQLLPPLVDYESPQAQARWRRRLHDIEPALFDYARHGPDDPLWQDAVIPGGAITVPALLVGGWRDSFARGMVEAYERLAGPKRLIIGPWGHVLPHESAHGPIDFLTIALQWWQRWLRGQSTTGAHPDPAPGGSAHPNGRSAKASEGTDEAPILLSLGDTEWRAYDNWPPAATGHLLVAMGDVLVSRAAPAPLHRQPAAAPEPVGQYTPDPTVGTLRGLPGLGLGESCPPQDQHDDDLRCVHATGAPLPTDLLVGGRPEVTVRLDSAAPRVVVRLCVLDRSGRSTLIGSAVLRPGSEAREHRIVLPPVHLRLPAGARLRVTVGDADFPRLTPLTSPIAFTVLNLAVVVPVVSDDAGRPAVLPALPPQSGRRSGAVDWTIIREPGRGRVEVTVASDTGPVTSRDGHRYHVRGRLSAAVSRDAPSTARCTSHHRAEVRLATGEHLTATVQVYCSQDAVYAHGRLAIDGFFLVDRRWQAPLQRE